MGSYQFYHGVVVVLPFCKVPVFSIISQSKLKLHVILSNFCLGKGGPKRTRPVLGTLVMLEFGPSII